MGWRSNKPRAEESDAQNATIPLGDVELLQGLKARLAEVRARAAGATCLIEATTAEVTTR